MTIDIKGPIFVMRFRANELTSPIYNYALPKGYSINTLYISTIT